MEVTYGKKPVEEMELDKQVLALFDSYNYEYIPTFPSLLVRVLPREQRYGRLILPDNKSQNKPVFEGIVLRTWKPFNKEEGFAVRGLPKSMKGPIESQFKPGDHILFPHWIGVPMLGLHEAFYRSIPETFFYGTEHGNILGILEYTKESVDTKIEAVLDWVIRSSNELDKETIHRVAKQMLADELDMVVKIKGSKTISGR